MDKQTDKKAEKEGHEGRTAKGRGGGAGDGAQERSAHER